jgi:hypothetical protein
MNALRLFVVLVLAHGLMIIGQDVAVSGWTLAAYLWQDAAVALAFASVDRAFRGGVAMRILYGLVVAWAALNVPIAWTLSSPLTPAMLRAARGTLWDSIAWASTPAHFGAIALVGASGLLASRVQFRVGPRMGGVLAAAGLAIVATGPSAASRIETGGWHRNAFGALWPSRGPVSVDPLPDAWRESPFGSVDGPGLTEYRGAASGRHVVLVVLESAGARVLAPYGSPRDPMPNLTALARRSLVFDRAYAVYPESVKGLLPVLCSVYPAFGAPAEAYAGFPCPSIARELARGGYRTSLVHSGRFGYLGMRAVVGDRGFEVLEDAGDISGTRDSSFGVDEEAAVARILSWIDSLDSGERFFLTYLPVAGHHPYAAPGTGPFPVEGDFDRYLNALHYADRNIGALLDGLVERGLWEEVLLVVFGDHGEAFGDHGGNVGHSFFIYETNVRVPYLVAIPGVVGEAMRVPASISLVDTAPTILDLLGLPIPPAYQGVSALDGKSRMAFFFADYGLGWLGLYDACWKYLFQTDSERSALYDVCRDPDETRNLAAAHPERIPVYRARVEAWAAAGVRAIDGE